MKKKLKVFTAAILAAILLFCTALTAFAERAPLWIGDADSDGEVTVLDATKIQRALAELTTLTKRQAFAADTDGSGSYDILDATRIQRKLADLPSGFYTDGISDLWTHVENLYADYASGMAQVGTPVTFTIVGEGKEPLTYAFRINDTLVRERSADPTLTYTFSETGEYSIEAIVWNDFDESAAYAIQSYRVVEPYPTDEPVITNVYHDHVVNRGAYHTVTACAVGGTAPYRYRFVLQGDFYIGEGTIPKITGTSTEWSYDEASKALYTDYSDEAAVVLPGEPPMQWDGYYTLTVTVMDAEGRESAPYIISFPNENLPA